MALPKRMEVSPVRIRGAAADADQDVQTPPRSKEHVPKVPIRIKHVSWAADVTDINNDNSDSMEPSPMDIATVINNDNSDSMEPSPVDIANDVIVIDNSDSDSDSDIDMEAPLDFTQMVDSDGNLREGSAIKALLRISKRAMSPEDISSSFVESLSLTASRASRRSAKGDAGAGVFGSAGIFVQSRKIRNAKKVDRPYNDVDVMLVQRESLEESRLINRILGDSYTAQSCAKQRMLLILEHIVDEKTIAAIDVGSMTQVGNYDDDMITWWVQPPSHEGFVGVKRVDWETGTVHPFSTNGGSIKPNPFLRNVPSVSVYDGPDAARRTSSVAAPLKQAACAKMYTFLAAHDYIDTGSFGDDENHNKLPSLSRRGDELRFMYEAWDPAMVPPMNVFYADVLYGLRIHGREIPNDDARGLLRAGLRPRVVGADGRCEGCCIPDNIPTIRRDRVNFVIVNAEQYKRINSPARFHKLSAADYCATHFDLGICTIGATEKLTERQRFMLRSGTSVINEAVFFNGWFTGTNATNLTAEFAEACTEPLVECMRRKIHPRRQMLPALYRRAAGRLLDVHDLFPGRNTSIRRIVRRMLKQFVRLKKYSRDFKVIPTSKFVKQFNGTSPRARRSPL